MCVIIDRKPGIEIPFEKLDSACLVNADGYGIVTVDRGKMEIYRGYDDKGNDAEKIAKILEDAKDVQVMMHLRFTTVGKKGVHNTHPYPVLNMRDHGIDIQLMHNGTITGTELRDATNEFSDSYHFAQKVLTPLLERSLATMDFDKLFEDPFIDLIMKQYAGSSNVFTLIDNFGNTKIINKSRGKEFDGWWASNDYSFNRTHREPYQTTYYPQGHNTRAANTTYMDDWRREEARKKLVASKATTSGTVITEPSKSLVKETEILKETMSEINNSSIRKPEDIVGSDKRKTFCEMVGLESINLITAMEQDDFYELVSNYPEAATILLMDLQWELYLKNERQQEAYNVH